MNHLLGLQHRRQYLVLSKIQQGTVFQTAVLPLGSEDNVLGYDRFA